MDDVDKRTASGPPRPPSLDRARTNRAESIPALVEALDDRVETLLSILGKKHAPALLRLFALEGGPWQFSELEERLEISPHTLSERLSELTETGLLERHSDDGIPPRVEYTWTESAQDLTPVIDGLYDWSRDHDPGCSEPEQ